MPRVSWLALIILIFGSLPLGCAPLGGEPEYRFQSNDEIIRDIVSAYPTTVSVQFSDARGIVERLKFLFENGLKLSLSEVAVPQGAAVRRRWRSSSEHFIFQIAEQLDSNGIIYTVDVRGRISSDNVQAQLNAKNIARFISEGTFERSLFKL